MPPRLPAGCTSQLVLRLEPNALALQRTVAGAGRTSRPTPAPQYPSAPRQQQSSCFSTTAPLELTRPQREFRKWLKTRATAYESPRKDGQPNYVLPQQKERDVDGPETVYPFPNNREFKSQPVLSEDARETIWKSVMVEGLPLKAVSARFSVDMRRVAAVVRMKEIEKRWEKSGTPTAKPYAKAVMSMLPQAHLVDTEEPFEPINDIYISHHTQQQLFVPTPESRQFTRRDAAKAFGDHILPVDEQLHIPELLDFEKDIVDGVNPVKARARFVHKAAVSEKLLAQEREMKQRQKNGEIKRVSNERFEFRIQNISVEWSGAHGRGKYGVGWRYGAPHNDRRAGVVKIPTKVE